MGTHLLLRLLVNGVEQSVRFVDGHQPGTYILADDLLILAEDDSNEQAMSNELDVSGLSIPETGVDMPLERLTSTMENLAVNSRTIPEPITTAAKPQATIELTVVRVSVIQFPTEVNEDKRDEIIREAGLPHAYRLIDPDEPP